MSLLPVAEAQARIAALGSVLPIETVPLNEAAGRWVAEDVHAIRTQPAADLSAMDGYAIRFAELPGPWTVIGESAAGAGFDQPLAPGESARIFTGAPLPAGADTILIQEEATQVGDRLCLSGEGPPGQGAHVRRAGSDFTGGTLLVRAGQRLTPARIALAAIGGYGALPVRRRPRVTILSTGDELVPPGTPTTGANLPASNGPMLAALLGGLPVDVIDRGIVPDRLDALATAFRTAAEQADVIVTTGGASVGDHDLVRPALIAAGATIDFWRVAMKPGKPLMAGRLGHCVVLGLPGNPVSAFVTASLFLKPLLAAMMGAVSEASRRHAPLAGALPATAGRAEYLRGRWRDGRAEPLVGQDSAALAMLAEAELLIVRPPHAAPAAAGESVEIVSLA